MRWLLRQSTRTWIVLLAITLVVGGLFWLDDRDRETTHGPAGAPTDQAVSPELRNCDVETVTLTGRALQSSDAQAVLDSLAMEGLPSTSGRNLEVNFAPPMAGQDFAPFIAQSALMIGSKIQTITVDCTNGRVVRYPVAGA